MNPSVRNSLASRIAIIVVLVGVALVAAIVLRTPPPPANMRVASVEQSPVRRSTDEILALLPVPDASSPSGKVMAAGIAQVRKTPDNPGSWVTLGDLLAQG